MLTQQMKTTAGIRIAGRLRKAGPFWSSSFTCVGTLCRTRYITIGTLSFSEIQLSSSVFCSLARIAVNYVLHFFQKYT